MIPFTQLVRDLQNTEDTILKLIWSSKIMLITRCQPPQFNYHIALLLNLSTKQKLPAAALQYQQFPSKTIIHLEEKEKKEKENDQCTPHRGVIKGMNNKIEKATAFALIWLPRREMNLNLSAAPLTSVEFTTAFVLLLTFLLKIKTK